MFNISLKIDKLCIQLYNILLTSFFKDKNMINSKPVLVDTILEIKAVGSLNSSQDLLLEDGKSIQELLNEQKKEEAESSTEQCGRK